jgi:predicted TIM-barrel fold metal-dependent hydrolase
MLFGSDQMIWPETIRLAIETTESTDFLTDEQKRDIFYNNAARFLRLDDKGHSQTNLPEK